MAKDFYDPTANPSKKLAFSLLVDHKRNRTKIKVKLSQLKFFMMPHVFKDVSEFALQGLKKLSFNNVEEEAKKKL